MFRLCFAKNFSLVAGRYFVRIFGICYACVCGCLLLSVVKMNQNHVRSWKVMTWNVRGINSSWKWDSIKNKISEAQCDIVCLQETKKDFLDPFFLKKICPSNLDTYDFLPSVGASGGILIAWRGSFVEIDSFTMILLSPLNFVPGMITVNGC